MAKSKGKKMDALKNMILAKQAVPRKLDLPEPSVRKTWRIGAGLSQAQAAEIMSQHAEQPVSRSRFANWEAGLNAPDTEELLTAYREFLQTCREVFEEKQGER